MINGYYKVSTESTYSLRICGIWNPETKDFRKVIVDDYEYPAGEGMVDREFWTIDRHPAFDNNPEIEAAFRAWEYADALENGRIMKGMTVEVFKGRKYPHGTRGVVEDIYDAYDLYGRPCATYILTTDGKRIPMANCQPIA